MKCIKIGQKVQKSWEGFTNALHNISLSLHQTPRKSQSINGITWRYYILYLTQKKSVNVRITSRNSLKSVRRVWLPRRRFLRIYYFAWFHVSASNSWTKFHEKTCKCFRRESRSQTVERKRYAKGTFFSYFVKNARKSGGSGVKLYELKI